MATRKTTNSKTTNLLASLDKAGIRLAGKVITWNATSNREHTHKEISAALERSGLEKDYARELLPRNAFQRAARKMSKNRMIDKVNEHKETLVFQFTRKYMDQQEIKFQRETFLRLNKTTGKITCEDKTLEERAQQELDNAMEVRTTSDVTKIVQKLFDANADLFPIREQGGAYFVPAEHNAFLDQVKSFLENLGGSMLALPVPMGDGDGDKAIQTTIADRFEHLIEEHNQAIQNFGLSTRKDTLEEAAKQIRETRVKIEAYASYLNESSAGLLKQVEESKKLLAKQVKALSTERAKAPAKSEDGKFFGHKPVNVIRWMSRMEWSFSEARAVMDHYGFEIADATIRTQLAAGRKEDAQIADLSKAQQQELERTRKQTEAEAAAA